MKIIPVTMVSMMIERQSKWHGQPPLAHFDNDLRYWHLRVFTTFFSLNGGLYLKHVSPWWPLKFLRHWLNRPRKVPQLSLEMVLCQLPTSRSSDKVFGLSEVCIYLYFWLVWLLLQNSLDLHNCNLALKFLNFQIENLYLLLASNSSTWYRLFNSWHNSSKIVRHTDRADRYLVTNFFPRLRTKKLFYQNL